MSYRVGDKVIVHSRDHFNYRMTPNFTWVNREIIQNGFRTPMGTVIYDSMLIYCGTEQTIERYFIFNGKTYFVLNNVQERWDVHCFKKSISKKKELFQFIDFNIEL